MRNDVVCPLYKNCENECTHKMPHQTKDQCDSNICDRNCKIKIGVCCVPVRKQKLIEIEE